MDSALDILFKLDEGILVTLIVAALTPILAAPAGRLLDRRVASREKAAARVQASGDGSNNAAIKQSGTGNTINSSQSHATTTINVHQKADRPSSTTEEILAALVVAGVLMVVAVVAFLRVGAMPMKIAGGITLGLTVGILIHLLRSHATTSARVKAVIWVAAAAWLCGSAYLMDRFTVRDASLATANAKIDGWDFLSSWSELRKIEQTIGYVFLLGTILGVAAAVMVSAGALGTSLREHQRRRGGSTSTTPRWQQGLAELKIEFLALTIAIVALAAVVNGGLLTERIHQWQNDTSSLIAPGTGESTKPRCDKNTCAKRGEQQRRHFEHPR